MHGRVIAQVPRLCEDDPHAASEIIEGRSNISLAALASAQVFADEE
ncbi:MAG: hypothetical protein JOZ36_10270 [Acidobacteria bacterium]|nr:hypothetical protein [Acidobacteriota bacterium]